LNFELHKLEVRLFGDKALKKIVRNKNRIYQSANNHKIPSCHNLRCCNHNVSKGLRKIMEELAPIYKELDNDFAPIDFMDLEFYERWLNGRY
jgi:hypothetical protein